MIDILLDAMIGACFLMLAIQQRMSAKAFDKAEAAWRKSAEAWGKVAEYYERKARG